MHDRKSYKVLQLLIVHRSATFHKNENNEKNQAVFSDFQIKPNEFALMRLEFSRDG